MTQLEKRQTARILRKAQWLERELFDFITAMQEAQRDDSAAPNWKEVALRVQCMCESLNMVADLVGNTVREVCV